MNHTCINVTAKLLDVFRNNETNHDGCPDDGKVPGGGQGHWSEIGERDPYEHPHHGDQWTSQDGVGNGDEDRGEFTEDTEDQVQYTATHEHTGTGNLKRLSIDVDVKREKIKRTEKEINLLMLL